MWVRSQDGKKLIKCDNFLIYEFENNFIIETEERTFEKIGIYSTEEKALKVLDALQHCIIHHSDDVVYNMPQDSEVE